MVLIVILNVYKRYNRVVLISMQACVLYVVLSRQINAYQLLI